MTNGALTRRRFIVTSAAVAGALVLGVAVRGLRRAPANGEFERNERHRIGADEPQGEAARSDDDVDIDGGMSG